MPMMPPTARAAAASYGVATVLNNSDSTPRMAGAPGVALSTLGSIKDREVARPADGLLALLGLVGDEDNLAVACDLVRRRAGPGVAGVAAQRLVQIVGAPLRGQQGQQQGSRQS